jgi:hypothetical protein
MTAPNIARNKTVVLSIKGGQTVGEVARSLGMAKSTISVIWNRDKDKWGKKKYRDPLLNMKVRSLSTRKSKK